MTKRWKGAIRNVCMQMIWWCANGRTTSKFHKGRLSFFMKFLIQFTLFVSDLCWWSLQVLRRIVEQLLCKGDKKGLLRSFPFPVRKLYQITTKGWEEWIFWIKGSRIMRWTERQSSGSIFESFLTSWISHVSMPWFCTRRAVTTRFLFLTSKSPSQIVWRESFPLESVASRSQDRTDSPHCCVLRTERTSICQYFKKRGVGAFHAQRETPKPKHLFNVQPVKYPYVYKRSGIVFTIITLNSYYMFFDYVHMNPQVNCKNSWIYTYMQKYNIRNLETFMCTCTRTYVFFMT